MSRTAAQKAPAADTAWRTFKAAHASVIEAWLTAERTIASTMGVGLPDATLGDRLLAAEADLQRAIVDFAATYSDGSDPTVVALGLLRRAEAMLRRRGPAGSG